jgi:transposase
MRVTLSYLAKELSDDTKKTIIKLIESGHRASQVAQSLRISKSTIFILLKRWGIHGDTEKYPLQEGKKS